MCRDNNRFRPAQAILEVFCAVPGGIYGPDGNVLLLLCTLVPAGEIASAGACINNVRVARIRDHIAALAAAYFIPMLAADVAFVCAAGNPHRAVVLLCAVHVIEKLVIGRHVIELRRGLVVLRGPGLAAIDSDGRAAIVAVNHSHGIRGIDPEAVVIAMRRWQQC